MDGYSALAAAAVAAKAHAYAPYSGFQVGAALLCADGTVYTGCNVESAAYSATVCAERTALVKAVSVGARRFTAIAVAGSHAGREGNFCYPCGVCRQMLHEFAGEGFVLVAVKSAADFRVHPWAEMMPFGFGPHDLAQ